MEKVNAFGTEKIHSLLLKMALPVMLAQLIQALYNIIDSLFVGRYSDTGLTALSIIYPVQLLMIALAVGTGVGINTAMSAQFGMGKKEEARKYAGVGSMLALFLWLIFAMIAWFVMPIYARLSTSSETIIKDVIVYGRMVCLFSFGLFFESIWTKVHQSNGNMKIPMYAQIAGAITNIILDPILIFGLFGLPELGILGAAIATVIGQVVAAGIVFKNGFVKISSLEKVSFYIRKIFQMGMPNILMQSAYTFYILGLNLILAAFSDQAVTALGLYYKWQTFFFIPLGAMQTCIVPIISFNYAARNIERCKKTLLTAIQFGIILMFIGTLCFELIPGQMLAAFTKDSLVIDIGRIGFRFIGISFIPMVTSLIFPVFFQAIGYSLKSTFLTVVRTLVLFVPLGYFFSTMGLNWFWLTFPVTETITSIVGLYIYQGFLKDDYSQVELNEPVIDKKKAVLKPSHPGVIITIAREHGSAGKQIGKVIADKLGIPFYYKEMIALAARESGLDKGFISDINKRGPRRLRYLYLNSRVIQRAVVAQDKIIRKIAEQGSCVIVGRAAGHVLRQDENVVRIYIYASKEYKEARVRAIYGDSIEEASKNIKRSDKARASYYKSMSGKKWGDKGNYELLIDASRGIEQTANAIVQYVEGK